MHLSAYLVTFLAIFCQFYHFSDKCHKIEIVQTRTFANLKKTPSALFQIIKITFWCKNTTFFLYDMMPHLFKVQKLRTYLIRRLKFNNDNKCVFHFFGFYLIYNREVVLHFNLPFENHYDVIPEFLYDRNKVIFLTLYKWLSTQTKPII